MATYTIYDPNTNEIITDKTYKTPRAAEIQASRIMNKNKNRFLMSIESEESYLKRTGERRDWLKHAN